MLVLSIVGLFVLMNTESPVVTIAVLVAVCGPVCYLVWTNGI